MRMWVTILCWRILKCSPVFRYWYRRHMNELLFDMEAANFDDEPLKKWKAKFQKAKEQGLC